MTLKTIPGFKDEKFAQAIQNRVNYGQAAFPAAKPAAPAVSAPNL